LSLFTHNVVVCLFGGAFIGDMMLLEADPMAALNQLDEIKPRY